MLPSQYLRTVSLLIPSLLATARFDNPCSFKRLISTIAATSVKLGSLPRPGLVMLSRYIRESEPLFPALQSKGGLIFVAIYANFNMANNRKLSCIDFYYKTYHFFRKGEIACC